jgi:hypothetical protein
LRLVLLLVLGACSGVSLFGGQPPVDNGSASSGPGPLTRAYRACGEFIHKFFNAIDVRDAQRSKLAELCAASNDQSSTACQEYRFCQYRSSGTCASTLVPPNSPYVQAALTAGSDSTGNCGVPPNDDDPATCTHPRYKLTPIGEEDVLSFGPDKTIECYRATSYQCRCGSNVVGSPFVHVTDVANLMSPGNKPFVAKHGGCSPVSTDPPKIIQ